MRRDAEVDTGEKEERTYLEEEQEEVDTWPVAGHA